MRWLSALIFWVFVACETPLNLTASFVPQVEMEAIINDTPVHFTGTVLFPNICWFDLDTLKCEFYTGDFAAGPDPAGILLHFYIYPPFELDSLRRSIDAMMRVVDYRDFTASYLISSTDTISANKSISFSGDGFSPRPNAPIEIEAINASGSPIFRGERLKLRNGRIWGRVL